MITDTILPEYITNFLKIYPEFVTINANTYSGREIRSTYSFEPNFKYFISNTKISKKQFLEFNDLFKENLIGNNNIFVKNFLDYKIKDQRYVFTENKQILLQKIIKVGPLSWIKKIKKLIKNSLSIKYQDLYLNFSVEDEGDVVHILNDIPIGSYIYVSYEFYSPVQFVNKSFQYQFLDDGTIKLSDIELSTVL